MGKCGGMFQKKYCRGWGWGRKLKSDHRGPPGQLHSLCKGPVVCSGNERER